MAANERGNRPTAAIPVSARIAASLCSWRWWRQWIIVSEARRSRHTHWRKRLIP